MKEFQENQTTEETNLDDQNMVVKDEDEEWKGYQVEKRKERRRCSSKFIVIWLDSPQTQCFDLYMEEIQQSSSFDQ